MLMKGNVKLLIVTILYVITFQNCMTSCADAEITSVHQSSLESLVSPRDSVTSAVNIPTEPKESYQVTLLDAKKLLKSLGKSNTARINVYTESKDTILYAVNYAEGWAIIAGDKRTDPIIAESNKGNISQNFSNSNFNFWLETYKDELRAIKNSKVDNRIQNTRSNTFISQRKNLDFWSKISPSPKYNKIKTRSSVEYKWAVVSNTYCDSETSSIEIPHLIKTQWGQTFPWNGKLPKDTKANNYTCPTGCVAVSLAQIIYYMHSTFGKPTGLYHNINISSATISGETTNIGFSRSNYVSNSTRWEDMALTRYGYGNQDYVGDLMLDIGNRVNMKYSGNGSFANITSSALANYNLTYSSSDYNFQNVKNSLQNRRPVNVTAYRKEGNTKKGHSWIIDGIVLKSRHFVTEKHFEYTENWMNESEYYNSFDDIRARYNVNSEYDTITEDGGTYTTEYLLMNWGYDGSYDDGLFSKYPSDSWIINNRNYKYDKKICYDFK